jgi:hypothetical protein
MDLEFKKQDYFNRAEAESILLRLSKQMDERLSLRLAEMKSESQQKLKEISGDNRERESDKKKDNAQELKNLDRVIATT